MAARPVLAIVDAYYGDGAALVFAGEQRDAKPEPPLCRGDLTAIALGAALVVFVLPEGEPARSRTSAPEAHRPKVGQRRAVQAAIGGVVGEHVRKGLALGKANTEPMSLTDLDNDGIALDGIDAVAYYNGETLKGSPEFSTELRSVTYRFANEANLAAFQADPAKYIPNYAGSYLRDPDVANTIVNDGTAHGAVPANARLETRGMGQDETAPLNPAIDPELKSNPGFETDEEVEMSNLHDSNN